MRQAKGMRQPIESKAARKRPASRRATGRADRAAPLDMSPGQYIVKVDRATGEPLGDPIEPSDLLVHAHRDRHPVEIAAQFLASRLIHVTGNERLVKARPEGRRGWAARASATHGGGRHREPRRRDARRSG